MNKRQRKKQGCQPTTLYETKLKMVPAKELLYRPISHDSKDHALDFDYIMIPFQIQNNKLFVLQIMHSCTTSIYLEYLPLKDGKLSGYRDITADMKECFQMQETTGVEFYFGKLNNAYNHYMYVLNILLEKNIIDKETAKGLIKDIDFDENRFDYAISMTGMELEKSKQEMKGTKSAADAILGFLGLLLEEDDEE